MADLGYFLQSFNPVDFIKGYEQSEKFATEQDLAKARATTAQQQAEKEGILLGEFKTPQYTETRRAKDETTQLETLLSGELSKLNLGVTREPEVQSNIQRGLRETAAATAAQAGVARGAAEFNLKTQGRRQGLQEATLDTDVARSEQTQKLRIQNQDIALGDAAEKLYGVQGREQIRNITSEVEQLKGEDPSLSDYDALSRMAEATTDRAKLTLISSMKKNVSLNEAIRYQHAPQSPEFRNAISRLAPGITVGDVDPRTGAMPIYRVTGRDENGAPIVDRDNPVGMVPYTTQDIERFIYTIGGRMPPQQQRAAAGRAAAAKPGAPTPVPDANARIGGGSPTPTPQAIPPVPTVTPPPVKTTPPTQASSPEARATVRDLIKRGEDLGMRSAPDATLDAQLRAAQVRATEIKKALSTAEATTGEGISSPLARGIVTAGKTDEEKRQAKADLPALRALAQEADIIAKAIATALTEQQKAQSAETSAESERLRKRAPIRAPQVDELLKRYGGGKVKVVSGESPEYTITQR